MGNFLWNERYFSDSMGNERTSCPTRENEWEITSPSVKDYNTVSSGCRKNVRVHVCHTYIVIEPKPFQNENGFCCSTMYLYKYWTQCDLYAILCVSLRDSNNEWSLIRYECCALNFIAWKNRVFAHRSIFNQTFSTNRIRWITRHWCRSNGAEAIIHGNGFIPSVVHAYIPLLLTTI